MYVKVQFQGVADYFQIFSEDVVKVSLYIQGSANPKSVVLAPQKDEAPVCEPTRVADTIECQDLQVYCRAGSEKVVYRIVTGGKILYNEVSCDKLL